MTDLFILACLSAGFGMMLCLVYLPLCVWLYADYRSKGGHESLWRYIDENC